MAVENLIGIDVRDHATYQAYRSEIKPLLVKHGGRFGYDFRIGETLHSQTPEPINRLFTLQFDTADCMDAFFSDPTYLEIKNRLFVPSVGAVTRIARYPRDLG